MISRHLKNAFLSVSLLAALVAGAPWAGAYAQAPGSASSAQDDLIKALKGAKVQSVAELDRSGLSLVLNDDAEGVLLEGWSTKPLTPAQADALFKKFGVRTEWNAKKGTATFQVLPGVGRAGVLDGETFLRLDGKVYKGLTLKGYGGNSGHYMGAQPEGSLKYDEAIRDMEMSKILLRNHVDTYLGVLVVKRPGGNANYVRLSRTAIRMDALAAAEGKDLARLVDYLTTKLEDEVGRKMNPGEFDEWLVKATADVIARKEHIRFQHASLTLDNLGIAELVDLGDVSNFSGKGGIMLPGEYRSQIDAYKGFCRQVHDKLATINPQAKTLAFDATFDSTLAQRLDDLRAIDRSRVNLSAASEQSLMDLGFTQTEAQEVLRYNISTPDGIIDPLELKQIQGIAGRIDGIYERATTDFMRLADGTALPRYYLESLGGAQGVRDILAQTRAVMEQKQLKLSRDASGALTGDVAEVQAEVERLALERAQTMGLERVVTANQVTNFSRFIAAQAMEVLVKR